ncbi:hypothetical protein RI129_012979 [Pyrocoelia pectoralis]|uniref:Peptidase S1 domain-containing protein n=1 Tax=Pyrocoelia pectoralis TaxID=417401 RepID=A0AAN7V7D3_9COLE
MTVVAGTNTLIDDHQTNYTVHQAIVHENFDPSILNNDIGILRLTNKINFNDRIQPIPLTDNYPLPGTPCTLAGWGATSYPSQGYPNNLQYINLTTISLDECKEKLIPGSRPITEKKICTLSKEGMGPCGGDSGGGLLNNVNGTLVGIVSWGYSCATGRPDIYTNVHAYLQWMLIEIYTDF